jgi:hypothetical protein
MAERKEHIIRAPLPWRDEDAMTECGLDARDALAVSREAMERKVHEQGQARAAFTSCMTCWQAVRDNRWAEDRMGRSASVLLRHLQRAHNPEEAKRMRRELEALVLLVRAHRDEFDTIVRDATEAVDLGERRRQRTEAK